MTNLQEEDSSFEEISSDLQAVDRELEELLKNQSAK